MNFLELQAIAAPLLLTIGGAIVLLLDLSTRALGVRRVSTTVGVLFSLLALTSTFMLRGQLRSVFGNGIGVDGLVVTCHAILAVISVVTLLTADDFLGSFKVPKGEYRALAMFAISGAMILSQSLDLVNVFVGVEIMSVAFYVIAGYRRGHQGSEEASVKYFLQGAFASALLLFGIAMVYGSVGLAMKSANIMAPGNSYTNFDAIFTAIRMVDGFGVSPLFVLGSIMVLVGLLFKAGIVPFHMVAPDVYQGAQAPVSAFLATTSKVGAFAVLIRFLAIFNGMDAAKPLILVVSLCALLSIFVGNVGAAKQTSVKRLLGYSSIAHAGYMSLVLVVLMAAKMENIAVPVLTFYLIGYVISTFGTFSVVSWTGSHGEDADDISRFNGLAKRNPSAALVMSILLFSLSGVPLTVGFIAKLELFLALIQNGGLSIAIVALIGSAVGLYAYLRLIVAMYFKSPTNEIHVHNDGVSKLVAVSAATLALVMGVFPSQVLLPEWQQPKQAASEDVIQ